MSSHGYFGDAGGVLGGLLGYGTQHRNPNYWDAVQNQQAAYNSQYNSQAQSGINNCWQGVPPPAVKAEPKKADCEGCGAPLKAYIHHCEYCRRPI